jgi:uncharacterized membrane protein
MKKYLAIFLLTLMVLPAVRTLFLPGYFPMHDDTQVARIVVMANALKNGQFPVRWVDGLGYGYGYPLFNFYAPLPYYVGGFLHALGLEGVLSTKIMFILAYYLAAFFMYFLVKRRFGTMAALLAAVLYTYAPYHAVQTYVRGAVGELWAYGFLPLLLIFTPAFREKNGQANLIEIILSGLGLAAVILSHTIYGYLTTGVLGFGIILTAWLALKNQEAGNLFAAIRVFLIGLMLSAFFWLPALAEKQYTRVEGLLWDQTSYADHFVCLPQLWNSLWGYGGSAPGCLDGLSFMAGKLHLLLTLVSLAVFYSDKNRRSGQAKLLVWLITAGSLTVFFMVSASRFVWDTLPLAEYIQYPWRLLSLLALVTAMIPAVNFSLVGHKLTAKVLATALFVAVLAYYPKWFVPQSSYSDTSPLVSRRDVMFRVSRISDEYLPPDFRSPADENEVAAAAIMTAAGDRFDYTVVKETYIKAEVTTTKPRSSFRFNRVVFPGWKYLVNGKPAEFETKNAVPEIRINKGTNIVEMIFEDTPVRRISNIISLVAAFSLLYLYGKKTYG